MDLYILKDYIDKRLNMTDKYPKYKEIHKDFNNNLKYLQLGISIINNDNIINFDEIQNLKLIRDYLIDINRKSIEYKNIICLDDTIREIKNIESDIYEIAINIFDGVF